MRIEIVQVPYEDKTIIYNLIQLYRYDSSECDGHVINNHGLYLYKYFDHQWTDDYRRPLIVQADDKFFGRQISKYTSLERVEVSEDLVVNYIREVYRNRSRKL